MTLTLGSNPNPNPNPNQVEMDEQARRESIQSSQERTQLVAAYAKNRAQFGDNWF